MERGSLEPRQPVQVYVDFISKNYGNDLEALYEIGRSRLDYQNEEKGLFSTINFIKEAYFTEEW